MILRLRETETLSGGGALRWITLEEHPAPLQGPDGLIYRTSPQVAAATDGYTYVIKGPDPRLVFTEYAAYELARLVGVPVPEHALCTSPADGAVYFASRRVDFRLPPEAVLQTGMAENPEMLADTAAFDIWVVNNDRNLGNLVAGPSESPDKLRLYAIDFEGSEGLRGLKDLFSLTAIDPRTLLPHEELRTKCCRHPLPVKACDHIADSKDAIEPIAAEWLADLGLPRLDWCERATSVLSSRADRIHTLVRDAWR